MMAHQSAGWEPGAIRAFTMVLIDNLPPHTHHVCEGACSSGGQLTPALKKGSGCLPVSTSRLASESLRWQDCGKVFILRLTLEGNDSLMVWQAWPGRRQFQKFLFIRQCSSRRAANESTFDRVRLRRCITTPPCATRNAAVHLAGPSHENRLARAAIAIAATWGSIELRRCPKVS